MKKKRSVMPPPFFFFFGNSATLGQLLPVKGREAKRACVQVSKAGEGTGNFHVRN